ncbi:hypothetical protein BC832DRAFT_560809 [Gaertneriomyces semiglobifer]|nr:hypothetical protein BC832DRAFT_560809 [Gaertneriomyces semiglobifer]
MNFTADPCDDFYEFSCGGWLKTHPIPDDKSAVGTFDSLAENNLRILKDTFEKPYSSDPSVSPDDEEANHANFDKVQGLYGSCKDEARIDGAGKQPLVALLNEVVRGFPLGDRKVDGRKVIEAVANAHSRGASALFSMYVGQDDKDPDHNVINLSQSGLSLPSKEYYEDEEYVKVLTSTVQKVFTALLPDVAPSARGADWKKRANGVVKFETALAKISLSNAELTDPSELYNPYTIPTLQERSPFMPWESYFRARFPPSHFKDVISDRTKLIVTVPTFFGNLSSVVSNAAAEDIEGYLLWHHISSYASHTAKEVKDLLNELREKTGQKAKVEPPRWKTCVSITDSFLGELSARWFINEAFGGDSKKAAEVMVENIEKAFLERLPKIEWLDDATRKKAVEKVHSLVQKIGYADIVMKPKELAKKYHDAQVNPEAFFDNVVTLRKWHITENLLDILRPVDRSEWGMTPPTVNAYYNPAMNEIAFPAGILQPPFYGMVHPSYLNYGAIGVVVGHELTHAFDNMGRQYDSKGRLEDWWTNKTLVEFTKRTKCFVEQYGGYTVRGPDGKEVHVDGTLTLGENLADNGGLSRAYEAFHYDFSSPGGGHRNPLLPGFGDMTRDQIFFVSFAQVWCSNMRPELALRRVRTDPHSPNRYRVIGSVSNSQEFAKAYKCPVGSKMNPKDKCLIW